LHLLLEFRDSLFHALVVAQLVLQLALQLFHFPLQNGTSLVVSPSMHG
jgi:hypothetical protein